MTIAEIESTLRTLAIRHPNLDDELLVTLLTAGGWESKVIKDATSLFKSNPNKYKSNSISVTTPAQSEQVVVPTSTPLSEVAIQETVSTPSPTTEVSSTPVSGDIVYFKSGGEEEGNLPISAEVNTPVERKEKILLPEEVKVITPQLHESEISPLIDLSEKIETTQVIETPVIAKVTSSPVLENLPLAPISVNVSPEPQSLIIPTEPLQTKLSTPPENLPLKPFESTPHVWPFSKYKEVFHGETMPVLEAGESALVKEVIPEQVVKVKPLKKVKIKRTGFDGEDEGLIFLTATTLLIILLLLAYMYSNGRI